MQDVDTRHCIFPFAASWLASMRRFSLGSKTFGGAGSGPWRQRYASPNGPVKAGIACPADGGVAARVRAGTSGPFEFGAAMCNGSVPVKMPFL